MLNFKSIKEAMIKLVETHNMPIAYKDDLNIDYSLLERAAIEQGSAEYIWILRPHGTCLIPLYRGANPVHISAWESVDNLFFHIAGNHVNRVNYDIAYTLISEFPFAPNKNSSMSDLMGEMDKVLNDPIVQSSAFEVVHLNSTFSSWTEWARWFSQTDNQMMFEFMTKAIAQVKKLNTLRFAA